MKLSFNVQPTIALRFLGISVLAVLVFVTSSAVANDQPNSATVDSLPREHVLAISSKIDQMVKSKLAAKGEKLNSLSSDEVFLRRIYLDAVGRIPSYKETQRFLESKNPNKRAELIDDLLDSYGYVSRQFNFWADTLRIQSKLPGQLTGVPYIDFVKDSLESNKPYDQFVRDLISAEGINLKKGHGAVGYYLRDRNMPEDNMSNTVRIFLGTRLECAQCHDHPFDKWTQRQYFEMVAFTGGIRYRGKDVSNNATKLRAALRSGDIPKKYQGAVNRVTQNLSYGIAGSGTGLARLPEGFLGEDGYEGEIVTGKTMFDGKKLVESKVPTNKKNQNRKARKNTQQGNIYGARELRSREAYANWLTDPTNPRFAKVIANRLWKQAFGLGLIEPIDIIEDNTVSSNPELIDYLTETMIALNFDMKQYLRAVYNSKTYQANAYGKDVADPTKFYFNGPVVRRMSAEQIWDSLMVLTLPNVDQRSSVSNNSSYASMSALGSTPYEIYDNLSTMNFEKVKELVQNGGRAKGMNKNTSLKAERNRLQKQLKQAMKSKKEWQIKKVKAELAKVTNEMRSTYLMRASEMPSPAPAGHFLREFGQSDREQIDGANTDPAVPQVLSMMNGYVEERFTKDKNSVLRRTTETAKSANEATNMIFLSMLNRKPTSKEARDWKNDFKEAINKNQAEVNEVYTDLIWMLANSNEFVFIK